MRFSMCSALYALALLAGVGTATPHARAAARRGSKNRPHRRQQAVVTTTTAAHPITTTRPTQSTTSNPSPHTSDTVSSTPSIPSSSSSTTTAVVVVTSSSSSSSFLATISSTITRESSIISSTSSPDASTTTLSSFFSSSPTTALSSERTTTSETNSPVVTTSQNQDSSDPTTASITSTSSTTSSDTSEDAATTTTTAPSNGDGVVTTSTSNTGAGMSSSGVPSPSSIETTQTLESSMTTLTTNTEAVVTTVATSMDASTSTTSTLPAGPTAKLIPVLNPDISPDDIKNLIPQLSSSLYYLEQGYDNNPYVSKMFAKMDVQFQYWTVLVENSDFVTNADCSSKATNELNLDISTFAAYITIKNNWPFSGRLPLFAKPNPIKQMVLILNGQGCGAANNTRSFWLGSVSQFTMNCASGTTCAPYATAKFIGDEIALEQGITDGHLQWGTVTPPVPSNATQKTPNNPQVCSVQGTRPAGIITANACANDFDKALDYNQAPPQYIPSTKRQSNLGTLLENAVDHVGVVNSYLSLVQTATPVRRWAESQPTNPAATRVSSVAQVTAAPDATKHLDGRGVGDFLSSVWHEGTSSVDSVANVVYTQASDTFNKGTSIAESVLRVFATDVALAASYFGDRVEDTWTEFEQDLAQFGRDVNSVIQQSTGEIGNALDDFSPQGTGTLNIDLAPHKLVDSPWGEAYKIYQYPPSSGGEEKRTIASSNNIAPLRREETTPSNIDKSITAYCVDCGIKGVTTYAGAAKFSTANGVESLYFSMVGPLEFNVGLGLDAEIKYTMPQKVIPLIPPQGVPIMEIEGIIVVGPILEMDLTIDATIYAGGQVIAGTHVPIPNFSANFDFVNTGNSYVRGFDNLQPENYFAAAGQLGASVTLGMPFSVGVGVTLPPVKFDKQIKLVNTPAITTDALFEVETKGGDAPENENSGSCPNGFNYNVTFTDNVDLNVFDLYTYPVYSYTAPTLASGCYHIPGLSTEAKRDTTSNAPLPSNFPTTKYSNGGMVSSGSSVSNSGAITSLGRQLVVEKGSGLWMVCGNDGNLYMQSSDEGACNFQVIQSSLGRKWANPDLLSSINTNADVLVTDDRGRGLFMTFFEDLLHFSAARVRLYDLDEVPYGAMQTVIGSGSVAGATSNWWLADINSAYVAYFMVGCVVTDAVGDTATKVFAVLNLEEGIGNLTSNDYAVMNGVTGGYVSSCAYLPLNG